MDGTKEGWEGRKKEEREGGSKDGRKRTKKKGRKRRGDGEGKGVEQGTKEQGGKKERITK